jgi:hypothetical protein
MAVGRPSIDRSAEYAGRNLIEMSTLMNTFFLGHLFRVRDSTGLLLPRSPQISTTSHTRFQEFLHPHHSAS